jgi:protoporphyrinogen oxidase
MPAEGVFMEKSKQPRVALIIGAGPAGLTAAYELMLKTDIKPIIFEASGEVGGISKTVNYKGNRIDIGGHRFFSKSDRVMKWWLNIMPLQGTQPRESVLPHSLFQPEEIKIDGPDPKEEDRVLLLRSRLSRIYFLHKFFNYPVSLNMQTIKNMGITNTLRVMLSYLKARLFPIKPEKALEDLYVNRFGRYLFNLFFEFYTEKVWGIHPRNISPEWGAQRVKGISITAVLKHAFTNFLHKKDTSIEQKHTETSLIEQFLYPKFGPGQMWETVADILVKKDIEVNLHHTVVALEIESDKIRNVLVRNEKTGQMKSYTGDYVFSTMPVKDLVKGLRGAEIPMDVQTIADGLPYRDFMTVGLLLNKLNISNNSDRKNSKAGMPDNWIYIQDREVRVGRIQIFNNWSPYMVKDISKVWIGLEYFVSEGDELWTKPDDKMIEFAKEELARIGMIDPVEVIDAKVIRVKKAYPAYFGMYDKFAKVRDYLSNFDNLFLIGRNGMHRYNNQDHSMLTAMVAVENIVSGNTDKSNIWAVNAEETYHESK